MQIPFLSTPQMSKASKGSAFQLRCALVQTQQLSFFWVRRFELINSAIV